MSCKYVNVVNKNKLIAVIVHQNVSTFRDYGVNYTGTQKTLLIEKNNLGKVVY